MKIYIGIDNGTTGTIGVISDKKNWSFKIPIKVEQSYTKRKQNIARIDVNKLETKFDVIFRNLSCVDKIYCYVERPMVNPMRFKATMSAMRALEATINVLELMGIPFEYQDSKKWQKLLLPLGCQKQELKKASRDIGIRLFPEFKDDIIKHGDADGILIAEYCKRMNR